MDNPDLEKIYAAAYGLYEAGDYSKAAGLFTHLIFQKNFEARYWKGLAAARQMEGDQKAALHAWAVLSILSPADPLPHFHAAECMISLGEVEEAVKALVCSEKQSGAPKEKIELLKQRLLNG